MNTASTDSMFRLIRLLAILLILAAAATQLPRVTTMISEHMIKAIEHPEAR